MGEGDAAVDGDVEGEALGEAFGEGSGVACGFGVARDLGVAAMGEGSGSITSGGSLFM